MLINDIITEQLGLPVRNKHGRPLATPENRQVYNLLDLVTVTAGKRKQGELSVNKKPQANSILRQSGIYIWTHPKYGIFYVGIAAKNNLEQRWGAHINKLLGTAAICPTGNWKEFSTIFLAGSGGHIDTAIPEKELEGVKLYFYPVPKREGQSDEEYKKDLEDTEDRIARRWNPRTMGIYRPGQPSVTRNI